MSEEEILHPTRTSCVMSHDGCAALLTFHDDDAGKSANLAVTPEGILWLADRLPQLLADAQGERVLGTKSALLRDRSGQQPQMALHLIAKFLMVGFEAGGTIIEFLTQKDEPIRMAFSQEVLTQLSASISEVEVPSDSKPLIESKTFQSETVYLDRAKYKNCEFIDCELIYTGGEWSLDSCRFDRFILNFEGAADRMLVFLQWLYVHEGASRAIAEEIMEKIRASRAAGGKGN
jgi:hypothetical protein